MKQGKKHKKTNDADWAFSNKVLKEVGTELKETDLEKILSNSGGKKQSSSLIENYNNFVMATKNQEGQLDVLKKQLQKIQEKKSKLKINIANKEKKLGILEQKKVARDKTTGDLQHVLHELREKIKIKQFTHDQMTEDMKTLEEVLKKDLKKQKLMEYNLMDSTNLSTTAQISQERVQLMKIRKEKQDQLNKILLLIKQGNTKNYNVSYLKELANNLIKEINCYKDYKTDDLNKTLEMVNLEPS